MKIPIDAVVMDDRKFTHYLLIYKPEDDKSQFLGQAGYTLDNWEQLKADILTLISENDAIVDRDNEFGTYYRVDGKLQGVNEKELLVTTIWIHKHPDNVYRFVTLKPRKTDND